MLGGWLGLGLGSPADAAPGFPFYFEPHPSDAGDSIEFRSRTPHYAVRLAPAEIALSLPQGESSQLSSANPPRPEGVRLHWLGANPAARLRPEGLLPGKVNYLTGGHSSNASRMGIPTFSRVHCEALYPGIDVVYYGNDRRLEWDLVVGPGADPKNIALSWEGAEFIEKGDEEDLVLSTASGRLRLCRPFIYQLIAGQRYPISGRYQLSAESRQIQFELDAYDPRHPVVIDPVVVYSQSNGGNATEYASAVARDVEGNFYLTGFTVSANFPTARPLQGSKSAPTGDPDVFVMKLNAADGSLIYATYLGGTVGQVGAGIAVDSSRNAWVAGWTGSADFPVKNPLQPGYGGGTNDVFLAKLNASGSELLFSTLLGGTDSDFCSGVALDRDGNAYVTGTTFSPNFPVVHALQAAPAGLPDAFVAKVDAAGTRLVSSTYLGGSGTELTTGIAVTPGGNAVITGTTLSTNFPLVRPWQSKLQGTSDVFVARFNPAGSALDFSTRLGGRLDEFPTGIAVGPGDDLWLTGATFSEDFPTWNAVQPSFPTGPCRVGNEEVPCLHAFVTRLKSDGQGLVFSTFLAGNGVENLAAPLASLLFHSASIAVDAKGFAYVTGMTSSSNFPIRNPIQRRLNGESDLFLAKLHPLGALLFSTYLGTGNNDYGTGVAADASGNVLVAGWSAVGPVGRIQNDLLIARLFELPVTTDLPDDALKLSGLRFNARGEFEMTLTGDANRHFMVEASTNLIQWITLTNR